MKARGHSRTREGVVLLDQQGYALSCVFPPAFQQEAEAPLLFREVPDSLLEYLAARGYVVTSQKVLQTITVVTTPAP